MKENNMDTQSVKIIPNSFYNKFKKSKILIMFVLILLGIFGRVGYDYWNDRGSNKNARIKAYLIMVHCAIVLTESAKAAGFSDTAESCTKAGMDSISAYEKISGEERKLQFMIDACRTGTHNLLPEENCRNQALEALEGKGAYNKL